MKLQDRSCFGQGIIACKKGEPLDENPFITEKLGDILKSDLWRNGWWAYHSDKFGDMKRHELYENLGE